MSKYKCLAWDWNGTLINDLQLCVEVMSLMLKKRNLPALTIEKYGQVFGFPVKDYYLKLGYDFRIESFENISSEFINGYQASSMSADLNEGSIQILEYIKGMEMEQVILSASYIENLKQQINHFGISQYFSRILGLDHYHATSKVELGREWLSKSGYDSKDVLLVGDTAHDFETADGLGCDCILYLSGHQSKERLIRIGVPIIKSLSEIKDYIN